MTRKTRTPPKTPAVAVGDFVLMGATRASYPGHWFMGEVLYVDARAAQILIGRSSMNGQPWLEVEHISHVRARGTIADLVRIQDEASKAVRDLMQAVHDCELALGRARDAVWAKLEEMAAAGLAIEPPDFEKIEADRQAVGAAVEAYDAEQADA